MRAPRWERCVCGRGNDLPSPRVAFFTSQRHERALRFWPERLNR